MRFGSSDAQSAEGNYREKVKEKAKAKVKVKVCCGGNGVACKKPGKFSAAGQLCL